MFIVFLKIDSYIFVIGTLLYGNLWRNKTSEWTLIIMDRIQGILSTLMTYFITYIFYETLISRDTMMFNSKNKNKRFQKTLENIPLWYLR